MMSERTSTAGEVLTLAEATVKAVATLRGLHKQAVDNNNHNEADRLQRIIDEMVGEWKGRLEVIKKSHE